MSSIFSTQNRQTFLRRKYCFLPTAAALSPPVGRWLAAIGLPPLVGSGMFSSPSLQLLQALPRRQAPLARDVRAPRRQGRRAGDALRLPPRHPASAEPATVAAPRAADGDARASRAPSCACRAASASRRCARSGT